MNLEELRIALEKDLKKRITFSPFREAISCVTEVYNGEFYLVGGSIVNAANELLYDFVREKNSDVDILLHDSFDLYELKCLDGYLTEETPFGSPRFVNSDGWLDIWCMQDMVDFEDFNREATLKDYLECVTLTTQSVAYDVKEGRLYGKRGLQAFLDRTVRINYKEKFELVSRYFGGLEKEDYCRQKAENIGFEFVAN